MYYVEHLTQYNTRKMVCMVREEELQEGRVGRVVGRGGESADKVLVGWGEAAKLTELTLLPKQTFRQL